MKIIDRKALVAALIMACGNGGYGMDATFEAPPASAAPVSDASVAPESLSLFEASPASSALVTTKILFQQTQTAVQLATVALEKSAEELGIDLRSLLSMPTDAPRGGAGAPASAASGSSVDDGISGASTTSAAKLIKGELALLKPSVEELARREDQKLLFAPKDSRFTDYYNALVLEAFKPFIAEGFDGPQLALAVGSFHRNFLPIAAGLKAYIQNIPGEFDSRPGEFDTRKDMLLKDLDIAVERGTLSLWDITMSLLRMQFIQREMTTDEVDLFKSLPEPIGSIIKAFRATKGKNTSNMYFLMEGEAGNKKSFAGLNPYNASLEDFKLANFFNLLFRKHYEGPHLPNDLSLNVLPVLGRGVLGLHFMLESWIQGKHYVAYPTIGNMKKAHGINGDVGMSPFSFTVHDMFHTWFDFRIQAVKAFAADLINKYRKDHPEHKDKDQKPLMSLAIQNAQDHYALMTDGLLALLYSMDKEVLEGKLSSVDHRKIISGFFWALHEPTSVNYVDLYKEESLAEIVNKLAAGAITQLEKGVGEDSLISYPFEGAVPEIGDEELKVLLGYNDESKYRSVVIEKTASFVTVSGEKVGEYSDTPFTKNIGTLYYQYKDAQDNAKGLGLSDLFAIPLDSADREAGRLEAITRIGLVNKALIDNLNFFKNYYTNMLNEECSGLEVFYGDDFSAVSLKYASELVTAFSDAAASSGASAEVVESEEERKAKYDPTKK